MAYNNSRNTIIFPILLALAIVLGMFLNSLFQKGEGVQQGIFQMPSSGSKLDFVLDMIQKPFK